MLTITSTCDYGPQIFTLKIKSSENHGSTVMLTDTLKALSVFNDALYSTHNTHNAQHTQHTQNTHTTHTYVHKYYIYLCTYICKHVSNLTACIYCTVKAFDNEW